MGRITVAEIQNILQQEDLLREVISPEGWYLELTDTDVLSQSFEQLDYHSGRINQPAVFICKGATFEEKFLLDAIAKGARYYISEVYYSKACATGFIVSDERRAMAALARAFYGNPDEKLYTIGITGTKGKTTVNYFIHHILSEAFPNQVAYLSTIDYSLDGKTTHESELTTPESVDLYRMLAEAVEYGMKYLVMEVSSQAYKLDRVYGLQFDQGLFLNFTPDHIGPLEHPSMEDYFYCKRQLLHHSKHMLLHESLPHQELLLQEASKYGEQVQTYGSTGKVDYHVQPVDLSERTFQVLGKTKEIAPTYKCPLPGDFNMENAAAAIITARNLGISYEDILRGLKDVIVPGRMMEYQLANGVPVYIDYAHNFDSLRRLLNYVEEHHADRRLKLLIGATGDKGKSRRRGFAEAISGRQIDVLFTSDDPGTESPRAIAEEIQNHLTDLGTPITADFIEDREQAVNELLKNATDQDVIVLAGKGTDQSQIIGKKHVPYAGDYVLVERFIEN